MFKSSIVKKVTWCQCHWLFDLLCCGSFSFSRVLQHRTWKALRTWTCVLWRKQWMYYFMFYLLLAELITAQHFCRLNQCWAGEKRWGLITLVLFIISGLQAVFLLTYGWWQCRKKEIVTQQGHQQEGVTIAYKRLWSLAGFPLINAVSCVH